MFSGTKKILFLCALFGIALLSYGAIDYILQLLPRVSSKLNAYEGLVLNTGYSGIADIYIIFSLLIVSAYYNTNRLEKFVSIVPFILLFCAAIFLTTRISLAFIRLFKLIIIGICFSPLMNDCKRRIPSKILLLIGFPYTLNFMRQVVTDDGFLPYGEDWF